MSTDPACPNCDARNPPGAEACRDCEEWLPANEEDGPPNDDWIHKAYWDQAGPNPHYVGTRM